MKKIIQSLTLTLLLVTANKIIGDINTLDLSTDSTNQIDYFAELKEKINGYTYPIQQWYNKHKHIINPIIQTGIVLGLSNLLYNYIEQEVKESYRIMHERMKHEEMELEKLGIKTPIIPLKDLLKGWKTK